MQRVRSTLHSARTILKSNGFDIGMSLAPWGVVGQGSFRTDEEEERRRQTGEKGRTAMKPEWERDENEKKISKALEEVAKQVGAKTVTAGKN